MKPNRFVWLFIGFLLLASSALADRTQVFTIRPEDGAFCEDDIASQIKKIKGIKKYAFDKDKLQISVTSKDGVSDATIQAAIQRAYAMCPENKNLASMKAPAEYPKDADVVLISNKGESIGSLKKHLAPGKYTIFDLYTDWCGPCKVVDKKLRQIMETRTDIAVRKMRLVDFNTPVVKELGPRVQGLPYVIVFDPKGKRTDIVGANLDRLSNALAVR